MADNSQTTSMSYTIIVDPKKYIITIKPRWWEFWKRPRQYNVIESMGDAVKRAERQMAKNLEMSVYRDF